MSKITWLCGKNQILLLQSALNICQNAGLTRSTDCLTEQMSLEVIFHKLYLKNFIEDFYTLRECLNLKRNRY